LLRPDAERLWGFFERQQALGGFVLVGGTALSMHLNHRVSEDLDFMIPADKLPRAAIDGLKRLSHASGFTFVPNDRPASLAEFEDTGYDYYDYQQDYIVAGTVKVTFVAPDPEVKRLLQDGAPGHPRVASLEEIFRLKCIACANRSKTRDWLDMFVLLQQGLFQPLDVYRSFELAGVPSKFDIAMHRLCSGKVSLLDEGYQTLLTDPPSLLDMQLYFKAVRDEIEIEVARLKARSQIGPGAQDGIA
jgi:predicted nucleotidyltransferase component of viral defense system